MTQSQVGIASRTAERLKHAATRLGGGVDTFQVDVRNEEDMAALFERVGPIDHLVFSAASAVLTPLSDMAMADFRTLLGSKLAATTFGSSARQKK